MIGLLIQPLLHDGAVLAEGVGAALDLGSLSEEPQAFFGGVRLHDGQLEREEQSLRLWRQKTSLRHHGRTNTD